MDRYKNIMVKENFGIIYGRIACKINNSDVGTKRDLFAPPYGSSRYKKKRMT